MTPKGKVAVVSNDAGGAEILSSWYKLHNLSYPLSVTGPAESIFKRKLGKIKRQHFDLLIENSDWVLTGTSWESDLEYRAIKYAKNKGKYVVSFLDHWVNYRERFSWHGPEVLPDEIWVGDEDAKNLAENIFKGLKVRFIENPYWYEFKSQ